METKAEIRMRMRALWSSLDGKELRARSASVFGAVEEMPQFVSAGCVAAYWSLPDEVYSHDFVRKWCTKKRLLLPVVSGGGLEFREFRPGCGMNAGMFSIMEPEGLAADIAAAEMIIVPGVAFDRGGGRLGRGKGFYDRLLKDYEGYKVGICLDFQCLPLIPREEHDVRMDAVVAK